MQDERRTLNDAYVFSESYEDFDVFHFVVEANCDYEYFFDYAPMRAGGYYAYGTKNNQPQLLIIPKYASNDAKLVNWPIYFTVIEAVNLLNHAFENDLIDEDGTYKNVRFELTSEVLKSYQNTDFDVPFFIVFTIDNVNYIAFQQELNLVIYHEDTGFLISSASS